MPRSPKKRQVYIYTILIEESSSFFQALYKSDLEIANEFRKNGRCRHCHGTRLRRSNYRRKARGLPPGLSKEVQALFDFRFSFLCNLCNRRTTPPSLRFLGRKVYVAFAIVWISKLVEETQTFWWKNQKDLFGEFISKLTIKRWIKWWLGPIWRSNFWKLLRGQLVGEIEWPRLIVGVWNSFATNFKNFSDIFYFVLHAFSPITRPEKYLLLR